MCCRVGDKANWCGKVYVGGGSGSVTWLFFSAFPVDGTAILVSSHYLYSVKIYPLHPPFHLSLLMPQPEEVRKVILILPFIHFSVVLEGQRQTQALKSPCPGWQFQQLREVRCGNMLSMEVT